MQERYELTKRIFRKKTINKYLNKSIYLYKDTYYDVSSFLMTRLFCEILLFILLFLFTKSDLFISVVIVIVFNYLCSYFYYDRRIKIKEKVLEKDASFFFQILLLSLKSGKNLLQAMEITIENLDNDFSEQLKLYLNDMKYGKSLIEVLADFRLKMSSNNIKSILVGLEESYFSGKDMVKTLEKELNLLNKKRISDIKTYINKLPIKISVISVFILIPLMLLLILSPVIIEYLG